MDISSLFSMIRASLKTDRYQLKRGLYTILLPLIIINFSMGCVVKEEINDTYNQAHLGLNEWSLMRSDGGSYILDFDVGYLIGLVDEDGIGVITWTFELVNHDREIIGYQQEEMREASPEKNAIFVEGSRSRSLDLTTLLAEGETYILWFTLRYNEEILHEQLFPLIAGEEGGDPTWINDLIGEDADDLNMLTNNSDDNSEGQTEDLATMEEEIDSVEPPTPMPPG